MKNAMEEHVVLVNERDEAVGAMEKLEAHRRGELHRAFSVFVFDTEGRVLLQRRAVGKYHSGGLWTNTCCGHPRPGEDLLVAARRRLQEEMGFTCDLSHQFNFVYSADLDHGLREHELDHVLFGQHDGPVAPDPAEASEWRYLALDDLTGEIAETPELFTVWMRICLAQVLDRKRAGA